MTVGPLVTADVPSALMVVGAVTVGTSVPSSKAEETASEVVVWGWGVDLFFLGALLRSSPSVVLSYVRGGAV